MKIYFDESYPATKNIVILGALFLSDKENSEMRKSFGKLKAVNQFSTELKYSKITNKKTLDLAKLVIAMFFNTRMPYYRACILQYSATALKNVPGSTLSDKQVELYVDSAKKLVMYDLIKDARADLFMDQEDRIAKSKFAKKVKKMNAVNGARITSVTFAKSHVKETELLQVCDLITGAILQNLFPTNTSSGKYKSQFSKYLCTLFGIKDFLGSRRRSRQLSSTGKYKFELRCWGVPSRSIK